MMIERHKGSHQEFNVWPCFVDALSSLLMILIFVIIGFCAAHIFLSKALNQSDALLQQTQNQLAIVKNAENTLHIQNKKLTQANKDLEEKVKNILNQLSALQNSFKNEQNEKQHIQQSHKLLQQQIITLQENLIKSHNALAETNQNWLKKESLWKTQFDQAQSAFQKQADQDKNVIESLKKEFSIKETQFKKEKDLSEDELLKLKKEITELRKQIPESVMQNPELLKYRSDFFDSLQNVIGGRSDIRVVGDRFVFQSEVLFDQGSDTIGKEGRYVLDSFIKVLKDIMQRIPSTINWVLIVDGHTDRVPIHNDKFDSNWELSASRAVSVVKYLIAHDIPAGHLAAAGFAEYNPLTTDPKKMAKNRRIEIRFDQR